MIGLTLLLLSLLTLYHWLLEPFVRIVTPLLSFTWLGWGVLAVALWLFAGGRPRP
jgi:hypothetical protein